MRSLRCALITLVLTLLVPLGAQPAQASTPRTLGEKAVAEAARHYNKPYRYGAAGPQRFDCSGFTMYVFSRLGRSLPHSSAAQYNARGVRKIHPSQLAVGDLVFTIRDGRIGHVGIFAGGTAMWAATESGDVVRKQSMRNRVLRFGRVT